MLILKQNSANSVPTPPAGKGTIFLDDSDTLSVKTSDGNVETFPTVSAANTQVVFIDGTSLAGNANLTYNKNTDTLTLSGTLAAGNVKTNNLLYANGSPWDLSDPGGSNTQVQFNDDESFGGSAAFTFNKSTNAVSMGGALTVTGNASAGNISTGGVLSVTGNANVGNLGTGGLITATGNVTGGNLVTTGTASVGELTASGNAVITGNLTVNGNITYVNVDTLQIEDPVISLGGGPNGAPLTNNDGKDRGTLLNYYTSSPVYAFMGWDNSGGEFGLGSNVSIVNDVVTFSTYGNLRAGVYFGNAAGMTDIPAANIVGNISGNISNANMAAYAGNVTTAAQPNITSVGTLTSLTVSGNGLFGNVYANSGTIGASLLTGTLTTAAQPNITSVGTLTSVLIGASATAADFTNATAIAAKGNSGGTSTAFVGLVGEGVSTDNANSSSEAVGLLGYGSANGSAKGTGVQGTALVKASADTGAAVGVRGISSQTHSGGYNIGVLGNAAGSGVGNYAFYVQAGDIASIEANAVWDLFDNSAGALSFNSSGKAGIIAVSTADGSEGVTMSGTLAVTGNITATAGIKTDNYYYANGSPVDFQQAGGSNTQVQFNDADGFGGSAAFTFNKTSNVVTMSGNLSVANVQATGALVGATLTSNGNANVGNLGTAGLITATGNVTGGNITTGGVVAATGNVSGGNITTGGVVAATGNVSGGNITTGGVVAATGNVSGGNITTGGVVAATGNVSGGNLTTGGALSVTGNANVGNIGATHVVVTGNVTGNLLPSANVTYDLGSDTQRWRDLYLAGNTITLGSQTLGANSTSLQLSGVLTANGAGLSYLNASNLATGTVPAGRLSGTYTITVDGSANTVRDAAQPNITSVGTLTSLAVTGNVTAGNVYANSGTIGANLLTGTLTTASQPNITSIGTLSSLSVSGNVSAGNLSTGGVLSVTGNANVGNLGTAGLITATGNVTGGNITTAGQLVSSVSTGTAPLVVSSTTKVTNLNADLLDGFSTDSAATANTIVVRDANGSFSANVVTGNLSGNATTAGTVVTAAQPNITSVGTLTSLAVTGNVSAGNVSGTLLTGTLTTASQPNITSVGTLSSLTVTGTASAGNLSTGGNLSVSGTGSFGGNVAMGNFWVTGLNEPVNNTDAATKKYVDDVAQGLNIHDSCAAATPDTLANITSGTITYNNGANGVGAYLSTTGTFNLIDGVNVQTSGTRILVKNEANAVHNGIYTYTNTTAITRAADFNSIPEVEAGDFTFVTGGTLYDNTGWVQTESPTGIGTAGNNISFTQFSGAGTYNAGTGLTLTGSTFSVNASQTQVTSVGTLTGLNVNGTVTASAFTANTGVFTGNGSGLSALAGGNVTGQVANAAIAGTVYTAAQPNITSVGTLTSLAVTGNITAGNVTGANLVSANFVTGTLTTAAQPNITSVGTLTGLGVNGTITAANITANTGVFTGNGSSLSALNASNLSSGTVPSARLSGSYSISVDSATTAGTVTTAAQPNITSVGTLTSLTVSGNVGANHFNATNSVVASTLTSNVATGTAPLTVTSTTRVANLNVAYANVADFVNISDVTTGTYYPMLANAATGNVSEGSNSALTFAAATGTLSATVFSGSGASLTNLNASNISSGTLAQARLANSSLTVNGTAISLGGSATITANTTQTLTFGSYLTGTSFNGGTANTIAVDATDAATASKVVARDANGSFSANVITANSFAGAATTAATVTTAAQPNITSVGQLTNLTVSGNVTANNFICNGFFDASVNAAVSAAGTAQGNATVIATEINVVSTVASGAGVALPTAVAGFRVTLINTAANALLVYPASGGQINSLGTNASYSLAAGGRLEFVATSTTQWYTMSAAYS